MDDENDLRVLKRFEYYMKIAFIWPKNYEKITMIDFIKYYIRTLVFGLLIIVGQLFCLYRSTQVDLKEEILYMFWYSLEYFYILTSVAMVLFIYQAKFMVFLRKLYTQHLERLRNIDLVLRRQERLMLLVHSSMVAISAIHILNNYFQNSFCDARYRYNDKRFICGMITLVWYPIELDNLLFELILLLTTFICLWISVPVCGICALMLPFCVEVITMKIELLRQHIKEINFRQTTEELQKEFRWCIEYHFHIMELIVEMNGTFGYYLITEYSLYSTVIAGMIYNITTDFTTWNSIHLMLWLTLQAGICLSGQIIENEVESLMNALYNTNWYEMPPTLRPNFKIFQCKLRNPVHLIAQPILFINNAYLANVLKKAFSFYMYLRNVYH